jgi:amino-acid N-acetyltransferase
MSTAADLAKPIEEKNLTIRKAAMRDIHSLLVLINSYATQGIMLPRTEFEMSENIRDFSVVYEGDKLIACGALHYYTPTSAEIRSLAVDPRLKSRGLGRLTVKSLEREAVDNGLHAIFAFTYSPQFFRKLGFREVERGELPLKAWKDCLRCPKFQACDEIAMLKALVADPILAPGPDPASFLVQIPQLAAGNSRP